MCEFVNIIFIEGQKVQTKYAVISFEFETRDVWFFTMRAIEFKVHGSIYPLNHNPKLMGFPKVRKEWNQVTNEEDEVQCMPPRFYNRLRNQAIEEGRCKEPGWDAPPYEDEDVEREFYR